MRNKASTKNKLQRRTRLEHLEERRVLTTFTVTSLGDSGEGTLRQAIVDANAAEGPDTIEFAEGLSGTVPLTSGQLEITDAVTIQGPGAEVLSVSGEGQSRVFLVSRTLADFSGLTIANGIATESADFALPPDTTASNGGGIFNLGGTVSLKDVRVTNNASQGAGLSGGGGVSNVEQAYLRVEDSLFAGNLANGLFLGAGGAILSDDGSTLIVRDSTFADNESTTLLGGVPGNPTLGVGSGGAIVAAGGNTTRIYNSIFDGNRAIGANGNDGVADGEVGGLGGGSGGSAITHTGFSLVAAPAPSSLYIADSLFVNNESRAGNGGIGGPNADGGAGGAANGTLSMFADSQATIVRSQFIGNTTASGNGGNGGTGGNGGDAGGFSAGAGVEMLGGRLRSINNEVRDNVAIGGNGGNGVFGGTGGDAGAALLVSSTFIAPQLPADANIISTEVINNTSIAGDGGAGTSDDGDGAGGLAWGGGVAVQPNSYADLGIPQVDTSASAIITNSVVVQNVAQGGNGGTAGSGLGGGVLNDNSRGTDAFLKLRNTEVADNSAIAGQGTNGIGNGGGVYSSGVADIGIRDVEHIYANVSDDCLDLFTDGECTNNTGGPVGPAEAAVALVGDLNNDDKVGLADATKLAAAIADGNQDLVFDLNGDDEVSAVDQAFLAESLVGVIAGDADLDGAVNFGDFLKLSNNFGQEDATWLDGDFDGDGKVGFSDFLALSANFGNTL